MRNIKNGKKTTDPNPPSAENKSGLVTYENFGLKALEKMGWREGKPIGKNPITYSSSIYEIKPRAYGLGLGAEQKKVSEQISEGQTTAGLEKLINERIHIVGGPHAGVNGILKEKVSEELFLVEINGENVIIEKENISESFPGNQSEEKSSLQKITEQNATGQTQNSRSLNKLSWVVAGLTVRITSKKFQGGRYYLKKGAVVDTKHDSFYLMLENGELIENVKEKHVDIVVNGLGELVMIIKGEHKGKFGAVFKIDRTEGNVWVKENTGFDVQEFKLKDCCAFSED